MYITLGALGLAQLCKTLFKISPGAKWHILAEPGNVSVSFSLDGFG